MRVIDGMHRLRAAKLKGERTIAVKFFDGTEDAAFVLAVQANITHGMPLSLKERRAAALRILSRQPHMSDRSIADATGLSAKTVNALRSSTADLPQSNARVGKDGRQRPVSPEEGRRRTADVIAANPDAPLREVARRAGVSLGTAHAVRKRIRCGENPVQRQHGARAARGGGVEEVVLLLPERQRHEAAGALARLRSLQQDPSLRFSAAGREVLRWLQVHAAATERWLDLIAAVPPHLVPIVADMALQCSDTLKEFANDLQLHHAQNQA